MSKATSTGEEGQWVGRHKKPLSLVASSTCECHQAQFLTLSSRFLDVLLSCKHLNFPGKPSLHSMDIGHAFHGHFHWTKQRKRMVWS